MCHDLKFPALLYLVFFETLLEIQWGSLRWTETVLVSHNKRSPDKSFNFVAPASWPTGTWLHQAA